MEIAQHQPITGGDLLAQPDPARQELARRFAQSRRTAGVVTWIIAFALCYSLLDISWSVRLRDWARSLSSDQGAVVAIYAVVVGAALLLSLLPALYISGFVLARRYGLVTQSAGEWWRDWAKWAGIALGAWTLGVVLFFWIVRAQPREWWLTAAALWWAISFLSTYAAPFLSRLFWKPSPLSDRALQARLDMLVRRAGLAPMAVSVIPLSKRARMSNAWLVGLGRTRRIVLADTMLQHFTHDEIETVLAHELGHHVHMDIPRSLAVGGISVLATTFVSYHLLAFFSEQRWLEGSGDVSVLPYLVAALGVQSVFTQALGSYLSRRAERAADRYAIELTGKPDAFRSAIIKLADLNLMEAEPAGGRWSLEQTHPVTAERLRMADVMAGRPPGVYTPSPHSQPYPSGTGWTKRVRLGVGLAIAGVILVGVLGVAFVALHTLESALGLGVGLQPGFGMMQYERGPAAPWSEIVEAGESEAHRAGLGADATLYYVAAYPAPPRDEAALLSTDEPLLVYMYLRDGAGMEAVITVPDSDPHQPLPSGAYRGEGGISPQDLAWARQQLAAVERGPRELLALTLEEGRAFGRRQGEPVYPTVSLDLSDPHLGSDSLTSGWMVTYTGSEEELVIWIDARTGRVLSRQTGPVDYEDY